MTNPNLNQAREWAEDGKGLYSPDSRAKAVTDIILSLPDQWVDAEKLREVVSKYEGNRYISEIVQDFADLLPVPKLPTLADMTAEERKACQWMQCEVFTPTLNETFRGVLTHPGKEWATDLAKVLSPDGRFTECEHVTVTPLPGSKLQWPGGVVDCEIVDETPTDQQPNSSETPNSSPQPKMGEWWQVEEERNGKGVGKLVEDAGDYPWLIYLNDGTHDFFKRGSVTPITRMVPEIPTAPDGKTSPDQAVTKDVCNNPRPEDVPADELWLVEHGGLEFLAKRNREDAPNYPWFITSVDGMGSGIAGDVEITLIHKLVPETHALPEGMRLADHKECGRVVVSQRADKDGNYKVFCSVSSTVTGDDWWYAHKNELTFLDGNQ